MTNKEIARGHLQTTLVAKGGGMSGSVKFNRNLYLNEHPQSIYFSILRKTV